MSKPNNNNQAGQSNQSNQPKKDSKTENNSPPKQLYGVNVSDWSKQDRKSYRKIESIAIPIWEKYDNNGKKK